MSKRYVLNPDTKRLVDAEGCAGLKIINQSMKKGIQIKYQSTKTNKTQKTLRSKCPKGEIKHEGKCIKKEDKPKGTGKAGRPKKTKPIAQKKTPQPKQAQKQTPKKTQKQAQAAQLVGKDVVMKIKEEIKTFYDSITKRYINALEDPNPFGGAFVYVKNIYIDEDNLQKMKTFMKVSGLSFEEVKQICDKVYAKHIFDENRAQQFYGSEPEFDYDPLDYSREVFDRIINNDLFKDASLKQDLKNYVREITEKIKGKVAT